MSKAISSLPVGAKVKDTGTTYYGSPIIWKVADKNHSGYPANSVTLIAANILKIAAFDAKESGNSDSSRRSYGNNRYALSNIRQLLNKSGSPWYVAQHSADAAPSSGNVSYNPYDGQSGFLTDFSAQMKAALLDTTLTVAKATVDGGGSESVVDKVSCFPNRRSASAAKTASQRARGLPCSAATTVRASASPRRTPSATAPITTAA